MGDSECLRSIVYLGRGGHPGTISIDICAPPVPGSPDSHHDGLDSKQHGQVVASSVHARLSHAGCLEQRSQQRYTPRREAIQRDATRDRLGAHHLRIDILVLAYLRVRTREPPPCAGPDGKAHAGRPVHA